MTDAASLLEILRGTKSPPVSTPSTHTTTASHETVPSATPSTAQPAAGPSSGSNDLDRLFRAFANPHSASGANNGPNQTANPNLADALLSSVRSPAPPPPEPAQVERKATTIAALEALIGGGQQQQPSQTPPQDSVGGNSSSSTRASATTARESDSASNTVQSASLLSLLQGMGGGNKSSAASSSRPESTTDNPTPVKTPIKSTHVSQTPRSEQRDSPAKISSAQQHRSNGVKQATAPSKPTTPVSTVHQGSTRSTVQDSTQPHAPFKQFVSPFDILDQTYAKEQREKKRATSQSPAPGNATSSTHAVAEDNKDVERISTPSKTAAQTPPSSSSAAQKHENTASPVSAQIPPTPATLSRDLLASQYVPSPLPTIPVWAPTGLRMPSPDASGPQQLTIDLTLEHQESLSPLPVQHTPVSIFAVEPRAPGAVNKIAIWSHGIAYATGSKGKVRVIDRESGSRLLVKSHKKELIDLVVAAESHSGGSELPRKRAIASAGADNRIFVCEVDDKAKPGSNFADGTGYHRLLDIQGSIAGYSPRFSLVRLGPKWDTCQRIAVALNDGRLVITTRQQGEYPITGDEAALLTRPQTQLRKFQDRIVDIAFSPDGTAIAVLLADGRYSIHSVEHMDETGGVTGQIQRGAMDAQPTAITFLAETGGYPSALAISVKNGTIVKHVSLIAPSSSKIDTSIELTLPSSATSASESTNFSQLNYHTPTQTLYVSSSVRGSLFALHLAFNEPNVREIQKLAELKNIVRSDADFLLTFPEPNWTARPPTIDHVLEVTTAEPIVSFVLDNAGNLNSSSDSTGPEQLGALILHPAGLHQVSFERPRLPSIITSGGSSTIKSASSSKGNGVEITTSAPAQRDNDGDDGFNGDDARSVLTDDSEAGAGRRLSLESSIHVQSEVEVVVDEADPLAPASSSTALLGGGSVARRPSVTPIEEEPPVLSGVEPSSAATLAGEARDLSPPSVDDQLAVSEPTGPETFPNEKLWIPSAKAANRKKKSAAARAASAAAAANSQVSTGSGTVDPSSIQSAWARGAAPSSLVSPTDVGTRAGETKQVETLDDKTVSAPPPSWNDKPSDGAHWTEAPESASEQAGQPSSSTAVPADGAVVQDVLSSIEDKLPMRIAKLVQQELEKHAIVAEEQRSRQTAAESAKFETMFETLSTTVLQGTQRVVERTLREQMLNDVVPVLVQKVSTAVSSQMSQVIRNELTESLPQHLEAALSRREISIQLARNFATAIGPSLDRTLAKVVVDNVVPKFLASMNAATESCTSTIQQEVTGVRKEIVREQSDAVATLENQVRSLQGDARDLKATLARMEVALERASLSTSLQGVNIPAAAATSPKAQKQRLPSAPLQRQSSGSYNQQPQAQAHSRSPQSHRSPSAIVSPSFSSQPRPRTPVGSYEETFTNALQPAHEPHFSSLVQIIDEAPPTRLEAVFPPAPHKPNISGAVVLSLAYRLSQVVGSGTSPLDDTGRKQLVWVRRCLMAMDGTTLPDVADFTPRVLESVISSVQTRAQRLQTIADYRGAEECRMVEQYARGQLQVYTSTRA